MKGERPGGPSQFEAAVVQVRIAPEVSSSKSSTCEPTESPYGDQDVLHGSRVHPRSTRAYCRNSRSSAEIFMGGGG